MTSPIITPQERTALAQELFSRTAARYPMLRFLRVEEHPEIINDSWLIVAMPPEVNEETMLDIEEFAASITTDILLRTGRYIGLHSEESVIA